MSDIKSLQRMLVVQSLYQLSINKTEKVNNLESFFIEVIEASNLNKLKEKSNLNFAISIFNGVSKNLDAINLDISEALGVSHNLNKMENLSKSIFHAAVFELNYGPKISKKIVIKEYLQITDSFYSGKEAGLVNGVLDNIKKNHNMPSFS